MRDPLRCAVSNADYWPRYYFDLDCAKSEIEEWLKRHKQTIIHTWDVENYSF